MKKSKMKRNLIITFTTIPLILLVLFFILPLALFGGIYHTFVNRRYPPIPFLDINKDDYQNLLYSNYSYKSNRRQNIYTIKYVDKKYSEYKGIVVVVHGYISGGQSAYLPSINFFASEGYITMGIDVSGNGRSLDIKMLGFEQGVIDLEYLIKKIKKEPELSKYKLYLYGHSWGGYMVTAVLNRCPSEVDAVASACGFESPDTAMVSLAQEQDDMTQFAKYAYLLRPFIKINSFFLFGKNANLSASDGMAKSSSRIFIIASRNDKTVATNIGYGLFYKQFANNPRFKFRLYEKRHHELIDKEDQKQDEYYKMTRLYSRTFVKNYQIYEDYQIQKDFCDALFYSEYYKKIDLDYYQKIINFFEAK